VLLPGGVTLLARAFLDAQDDSTRALTCPRKRLRQGDIVDLKRSRPVLVASLGERIEMAVKTPIGDGNMRVVTPMADVRDESLARFLHVLNLAAEATRTPRLCGAYQCEHRQ
jgi:hypothetical protein